MKREHQRLINIAACLGLCFFGVTSSATEHRNTLGEGDDTARAADSSAESVEQRTIRPVGKGITSTAPAKAASSVAMNTPTTRKAPPIRVSSEAKTASLIAPVPKVSSATQNRATAAEKQFDRKKARGRGFYVLVNGPAGSRARLEWREPLNIGAGNPSRYSTATTVSAPTPGGPTITTTTPVLPAGFASSSSSTTTYGGHTFAVDHRAEGYSTLRLNSSLGSSGSFTIGGATRADGTRTGGLNVTGAPMPNGRELPTGTYIPISTLGSTVTPGSYQPVFYGTQRDSEGNIIPTHVAFVARGQAPPPPPPPDTSSTTTGSSTGSTAGVPNATLIGSRIGADAARAEIADIVSRRQALASAGIAIEAAGVAALEPQLQELRNAEIAIRDASRRLTAAEAAYRRPGLTDEQYIAAGREVVNATQALYTATTALPIVRANAARAELNTQLTSVRDQITALRAGLDAESEIGRSNALDEIQRLAVQQASLEGRIGAIDTALTAVRDATSRPETGPAALRGLASATSPTPSPGTTSAPPGPPAPPPAPPT